jgi:hypothetical protein
MAEWGFRSDDWAQYVGEVANIDAFTTSDGYVEFEVNEADSETVRFAVPVSVLRRLLGGEGES